jgi:uncharacterized OB-fold protein
MSAEIRITAYQCKQCGKVHYPFHDRCLECKGREFNEITPQGDARLLAYTQIFNLPWGFDVRSLTIGVVEFANKVRAMGQIREDDLAKLKAGMKLKAFWEPIRQQAGEDVFGLVLRVN